MHSGRMHSLNPYTFIEIHRNLWKYKEIHMNFRVYILCPGFKTNSVMKLHSGRVDCILGGGSAFWAGAFSESIYIHRNP